MDRIIFSIAVTAAGFCIFISGIRRIREHSFEGSRRLDTIASMFFRTLDAVVSIFICAFEHIDVIAVLIGLSLIAFGISTLRLK